MNGIRIETNSPKSVIADLNWNARVSVEFERNIILESEDRLVNLGLWGFRLGNWNCWRESMTSVEQEFKDENRLLKYFLACVQIVGHSINWRCVLEQRWFLGYVSWIARLVTNGLWREIKFASESNQANSWWILAELEWSQRS